MKSRDILSAALLSLILTAPAFSAEAASSPQRMTPHFIEVPVEALAEAVGSATGKTFVIQPGIHISVTMISERALTGDELYVEFLRVLARQGLSTRQRGGYIHIIRNPPPIRT